MVRQEAGPGAAAGTHRIGILLAAQPRRREAVPDLDALDGVDRHHRRGEIGIELGVDRGPPSGRHAGRDAFDDGAERRSRLPRLFDQLLPAPGRLRIGAGDGVGTDRLGIEPGPVDNVAAELDEPGADRDFGNHEPSDGARGDARGGLAGRAAPAAAPVAEAIFGVIGIIRVPGAVRRPLAVIPGPSVDIVDDQADRRAGGAALERAGEDADLVGLPALRCQARGARPTGVEPGLDDALVQSEAGRAAIDERAVRRSVALAPGREAQYPAEAVPAHPIAAPSPRIVSSKPGKLVAIAPNESTVTGADAP